MAKPRSGGGIPAIIYTLNKAKEVGPIRLLRKMLSKNACKTCALGMGGQKGGMVNESGHFPEVCKKSLQAQVADMKAAIPLSFFEKNSINDLLKLSPKQAEDLGRLAFPLIHKESWTSFKPISWEEVYNIISAELKNAEAEQAAFYSSGRSSNEAAFLLQCFARVYGSNNIMNCSYYCHQASGVALKMSIGTGTATIELEDLNRCDLVVLLGANPASNHPRLMTLLANLKKRGGKVIVVNPLIEPALLKFHVPSKPLSLIFGTEIASTYIKLNAGGDTALLVGALKILIETNKINWSFVKENTTNFEETFAYANSCSWTEIENSSGLDKNTIAEFANTIINAKACIFAWAMGLTHHKWGVTNILALCNLALASGHIARPGAGLLPIRGHSNVQGIGSVGFSPEIQESLKLSLEKAYNKTFSLASGYDTFSMMHAAYENKIKFLFCLGGNLWGSNPDSKWSSEAMNKIDTTVFLTTKLNPGHFHGRAKQTIILPVLARDEEKQATTQESMFNYVRLSEGGSANIANTEELIKSENEIICTLAEKTLGTQAYNWSLLKNLKNIRTLIAETIPGWENMHELNNTGKEFTIAGRVLHNSKFPIMPEVKARMYPTALPPAPNSEELRLITLRSEGQFNSVVYEEYDLYRGITNRMSIMISNFDASKFGLKSGDLVTVEGNAGILQNIEVVIYDIHPGTVAMYYPEANILIRPEIDQQSKTPAFKSTPVKIKKE